MKRSEMNVRLHRLVRRLAFADQRESTVAATQDGIVGQAAKKTNTKSVVLIAGRPALCAIGSNTRTKPGPATGSGICRTFRAGEINDVDILERTEPYKIFQKGKPFVDMQFNCGDVAYGVPSVLYEIIEP